MRGVMGTGSHRIESGEAGYVLIMALFVLLIISLVAVALAVVGLNEYKITARTKIMDQAYAIAEAGINRALIECRDNPVLTRPGGNVYPDPTPQWGPHTEDFGGGQYVVSLWQSELDTGNAYSKVIRSRGTIQKGGNNAERTIETRVVVGAGTEDYDASFDYCIYNGMQDPDETNWDNDSSFETQNIWPHPNLANSYWFGNFTVDGASPYPPPPAAGSKYPKGAVYTRGSIRWPTYLAGGSRIKGNLVATDDIYLSNVFGLTSLFWDAFTIEEGNVIAGIDGSGSAYLDTVVTAGLRNEPIQLSGFLCAANDVRIRSAVSLNLGGDPISLGGIISGGNVEVTGVAGLSVDAALELGNVFSEGKTTIWSGFGVNTRFGLINAGRDSSGLGVDLQSYFLGPIGGYVWDDERNRWDLKPCGAVYSQGKVYVKTALSGAFYEGLGISLGDVHAGTDSGSAPNYYGGTGVQIEAQYSTVRTGSITSRGKVEIDVTNLTTALNCGGTGIRAGTDGTGADGVGTGVDIDMRSLGYTDFAQGITSTGKVEVSGGAYQSTLGSVVAGRDADNMGIDVNTLGVVVNVGSLTATGSIRLNTGGLGVGVGALTSGGFIEANVGAASFNVASATAREYITVRAEGVSGNIGPLKAGGNISLLGNRVNEVDQPFKTVGSCSIGAIEARGNVTANMLITYGTTSIGGIVANGGVSVSFSSQVLQTVLLYGIAAGGNVDTQIWSNVSGNLSIRPLGWWTKAVPPGCDKNTDALWSAGNITFGNSGSAWTTVNDYARAAGSCTGTLLSGYKRPNTSGLSGWTPGVELPGTPEPPARPGMPSYTGLDVPIYPQTEGSSGRVTLQGTPVDVNRGMLLQLAGLEEPVELMEPNWSYFEGQAMLDDIKVCPRCNREVPRGVPTCPSCGADIRGVPDPPAHILVDGGAGDDDGQANGTIRFIWDGSKPYSSQETIYSGDPNVRVHLLYDWSGYPRNSFKGTLVARGDIILSAYRIASSARSGQVLNLVSGHDIKCLDFGAVLWQEKDMEYHFWARDDIDLRDLRLAFYSDREFYGSFTAGDRFYYVDLSLWDDTTLKWSRWPLDPKGWVAPFEVLSWREV